MANSSKKIKILFVVEAMGGGVFTYIVDLSNELCKKYDMYVAYSIRRQTPSDYDKYFDPRVHLIKVKNFTREIRLQKDLRAFFELRKIAEKVQPDIIHFHSSKAGAIGRIAFDGRKIPLFYTPHGYSFLMKDYRTAKRILFKMVEKFCAKKHCTTISCSLGEHKETLKLTKHAEYVNNGINIKKLDGILNGLQKVDHPFTVYTLGRICYQKNPKLFNEIALKMSDVHFLWIGDGNLKNELTAPNVEITGWLDRYEAIQRAYNSDVFLLTSLWEGLPISLLESMYMKKLCIVTDVIGNHDVIHEGENGHVCKTVDEFVNSIRDSNQDIIKRAYKDLMTEYTNEAMANKYINIYESKLKSFSR